MIFGAGTLEVMSGGAIAAFIVLRLLTLIDLRHFNHSTL
jgi:hypothetical protein